MYQQLKQQGEKHSKHGTHKAQRWLWLRFVMWQTHSIQRQ